MKIGILGSGDVGKALAKGFKAEGYEVMIATRDKKSQKAKDLAKEIGIVVGDFSETASYGEMLVLCTLWTATEKAIELAGIPNFAGKIVIDTTNPLDFSGGMPPKLLIGLNSSAGEKVQAWLQDSLVVKAFNSVGNGVMYRPPVDLPPTMFICGNSNKAKEDVSSVLKAFGWDAADIGKIDASRELESLCILWVRYALANDSWHHIISVLNSRKAE